MRLTALAIAATMATTPTLAADSDYTAIAFADCLTGQTMEARPHNGAEILRDALLQCAPLYRIHRATAVADGYTHQEIEDGLLRAVALLTEEIMGR